MTTADTLAAQGLSTWLREGLTWRARRLNRARFLASSFRNGLTLAGCYWRKEPADRAVCWDGTAISHPPGKAGLCETLLEVWSAQVYTRGFYQPRPGDVVIDGGANIGLFSLFVSRAEARCRVVAFEPFDENYALLCQNIAPLGPARVAAINAAPGGTSGVAVMQDAGSRSLDHQLTMLSSTTSARNAVPVLTMAEALARAGAEQIAFFKVDIEGSEHDLFLTASDDDLLRIERFAVEYHDNIRPGTKDATLYATTRRPWSSHARRAGGAA